MAAVAMAARRARSSTKSSGADSTGSLIDLDVKPLPPEEERVRSGDLEKKVLTNDGQQWHKRFVVLTKEALLFARDEEENKVIDFIPLAEIEKVATAKNDETSGTKRRISLSGQMAEEDELIFNIMTSEEGHNSGRTYTMRATVVLDENLPHDERAGAAREVARHSVDDWIKHISAGIAEEKARIKVLMQGTALDRVRRKVKKIYESNLVQGFIAVVIFGSFALNLVNAEILPEDEATIQIFERFDLAFTIIFTVELAANLFANYWMPFLREAWNLFDAFVVAISLLSLAMEELPAVNMLRLIRIFRVIRLFRALRSLRQIINALIASIFPVISSFLVLLLVTCIYAVLGTLFFHDMDPAHFSKFSQSLFTMFQVCTGDSWASIVTRGNFRYNGDGLDHAVKFFFLSYTLIANMVLTNIVVAVLLDNFINSVQNEKDEERKRQREVELKKKPKVTGVLDPVLLSLSQFSGPNDLAKRVESLYKFLDIDDNGGLSFEELREGLRKFPASPHIKLTEEDFDAITEERALCNADGEMDPATFELMMLRQLQSFALRQLANTMQEIQGDKVPQVSLFIFKMLSLSVDGYFQNRIPAPPALCPPPDPLLDKLNGNGGPPPPAPPPAGDSGAGLGLAHSPVPDPKSVLESQEAPGAGPEGAQDSEEGGGGRGRDEAGGQAAREAVGRLERVEGRLERMEGRMGQLEAKMDRMLELVEARPSPPSSSRGSERQRAASDVDRMVLVQFPSAEKRREREGRRAPRQTHAAVPGRAGAGAGDQREAGGRESGASSAAASGGLSGERGPMPRGLESQGFVMHRSEGVGGLPGLNSGGEQGHWHEAAHSPATRRLGRVVGGEGERAGAGAGAGASVGVFVHSGGSATVSPKSTRSKYLRRGRTGPAGADNHS